ncbi:MAG TPA: transcriptional regulator [Treponema sp.]|nr:transcriptional regulator [Treponema sp.]
MESIALFVRRKRKEAGLTQEDFAVRSGLGLRFVRELEEGKNTVRLDKVNQALALFGYEAGPVMQERIK